MAASQNVTASAWLKVQAALQSMFPGPTPMDFPRYAPGNSFNALAANNAASVEPIRNARGECRALEVYTLPFTVSTGASVTTSSPSVGCTLTPADYGTSAAKEYSPNLFAIKTVSVNDAICGNFFANPSMDGAERAAVLVADRLSQGMQSMRNELDKYIADWLYDNRQTADFAPGPHLQPLTFDSGTQLWNLPYDRFKTPDTLTILDAMMANNGIGQYFNLGGIGGFYSALTDAQWRQLNDNERFLSRFGTGRFAFDIFNLDAVVNTSAGTTGDAYSFLIADGSYVFGNFSDYPNTIPQRIDNHEKPTWVFQMQDPILRINDNGVIRPVVYDVHYQVVCNGGDTKGFTFTHTFELRFKGILDKAPNDSVGRTGIMALQTTPGL